MRAAVAALVMLSLAVSAEAQSKFRTPWGHPDLQGIWSSATLTPLERPSTAPDKEYLTEAEVAEIEKTGLERTLKPLANEVRLSGELNEIWLEIGKVGRTRRTSLVVDPPDGKVPYTPEGRKKRDQAFARAINLVPVNSWEDRSLAERCLMSGSFFMPNPFYLNNHQILQSKDHVVIVSEVMTQVRIIPLDGRPPLPDGIRQWTGDSRGRWEGDTLVIETTNFNDKGSFQGTSDWLHLVERIKRVDANTLDYELTVSDPVAYTKPWTINNSLRTTAGPIYEYGCHEGNYGIVNILSGARVQDKARAEKARAQESAEKKDPEKK